MKGFERAQAEYESKLNDPYGYDEERYDEDRDYEEEQCMRFAWMFEQDY